MDGLRKVTMSIFERLKPKVSEGLEPRHFKSILSLDDAEDAYAAPRFVARPTPWERYWSEWFWIHTEILSCLERLHASVVYLTTFPKHRLFRLHQLSEVDWAGYHQEMHLHEMYMLEERLKCSLKKIERLAKRRKDSTTIEKARLLMTHVLQSFSTVRLVRDTHVHSHRISDAKFKDVGALILISRDRSFQGEMFRVLRRIKYDKARRKLVGDMTRDNDRLEALCETVLNSTSSLLQKFEPEKS